MEQSNPNQTPEQPLFTNFDYQSMCELYDYQENIAQDESGLINRDGIAKLVSQPVSLAFMEKFKSSVSLLEEKNYGFDGLKTPDDIDIEDLIAVDPIILKMLQHSRAQGDVDQKEKFAKALRIRRSILAYLYKEDEATPIRPEAEDPSTVIDVVQAIRLRSRKTG